MLTSPPLCEVYWCEESQIFIISTHIFDAIYGYAFLVAI